VDIEYVVSARERTKLPFVIARKGAALTWQSTRQSRRRKRPHKGSASWIAAVCGLAMTSREEGHASPSSWGRRQAVLMARGNFPIRVLKRSWKTARLRDFMGLTSADTTRILRFSQ
jgi:hypothetical protein